MADALHRGAPAVGSIAYLLDKESRRSGRPVPLAVPLPARLRDKDVIVVPHNMSEYDRLGLAADEDEEEDAS